ncbi:MAG: endolytic transglycosylase MltG [Bacteroidota bacterium]|nr:endolytic transglycosylase MltG [Bacteroidota bacterium]
MSERKILPIANTFIPSFRWLFGSVAVILFLFFLFLAPNNFQGGKKVVPVYRGEPFTHVVDSLDVHGVISRPFFFRLAGKIIGASSKVKAGRYVFASGLSNWKILHDIIDGTSVINPTVTVREGLRAMQIARLLHNEIGIDSAKFMGYVADTSLLGLRNCEAISLEGFLMPETYDFYWQMDEKAIVEEMVGEFRKFYVDSLQMRTKKLRVTINEVVTLASIVEGETARENERPLIAGLYYNRLRRRMKLEADPTIQYLINGPRRIHYDDLRIESPYNTYRNYGLPPGPINNPGRKSILAALYPKKNPYLYFVADGNGGHRFARTLAEHIRNVYEYRHQRRLEEKDNFQPQSR